MTARTAGRKGRPWRRMRERIFAESTVCWICGHAGAVELDHVIPRSMGGSSADPTNLRPAHGAYGRCPVCRRACNQARGTGRRLRVQPVVNTSRAW